MEGIIGTRALYRETSRMFPCWISFRVGWGGLSAVAKALSRCCSKRLTAAVPGLRLRTAFLNLCRCKVYHQGRHRSLPFSLPRSIHKHTFQMGHTTLTTVNP